MSEPPPVPIADAKRTLRASLIAARDALPAPAREAAGAAITARVDAELLAALPAGAIIALYDAIGSEVPTRAIAARALARGLRLAYPRVVRGRRPLALHLATPADLAPGVFTIAEPPAGAPEVRADELALVLLPGLGFDARGARLGWGRGHYDATLAPVAASPAPRRVGLAFESQLVARIPVDEHDLSVHLIATDVALHRARP